MSNENFEFAQIDRCARKAALCKNTEKKKEQISIFFASYSRRNLQFKIMNLSITASYAVTSMPLRP